MLPTDGAEAPTRRVERDGAAPRVRVITRSGVHAQVLPPRAELIIGRAADCDVRVDDDSLSRRHARVRLGAAPTIEDLGSANGVRLAGVPLPAGQPTPLPLGQPVELGEVFLVFELPDAGEAASSTGPSFDKLVARVAASAVSVLILGETGVGKEGLAERLHRDSRRAAKPLVKLNCAALPEQLLEGELFGYERGAFTGATAAKPGLLESAHGGTVFLDEIGELPLTTQAKLLRVLEQREVQRLGALRPIPLDVRFVAATHRDVHADAAAGRFRQDLLFRLDGFTLRLPPLRQRLGELPQLVRVLLDDAARRDGLAAAPSVSPAAMTHLAAQPWPGNIRQLRNELARALVRWTGGPLEPAHFEAATPTEPATAAGGLRDAVDAAERARVLAALDAAGGNQGQAAAALGISRRTLVSRLTQWGLTRARR